MFELLPFSGDTTETCLATISEFHRLLVNAKVEDFPNLAGKQRSLDEKRKFRYATACANLQEAKKRLGSVKEEDVVESETLTKKNVSFFFPPQGPQSVNMIRCVLGEAREFTETIERMTQYASKQHGVDFKELMYPTQSEGSDDILQTGENASTCMLIIEHAIAHQLRTWGIEASVCGAWSSGELAAALYADAIDEEEAVRFYAQRSHILVKSPPAAVTAFQKKYRIPEDMYLQTYFTDDFQSVLGTHEQSERYKKELEENNIPFFIRNTPHGFHTPFMDCILDEYRTVLETIKFRTPNPEIRTHSCVDASRMEVYDTAYWLKQIRTTLRLGDLFRKMQSYEEIKVIVCAGPLPIFRHLLDSCGVTLPNIKTCPSRKDTRSSGNVPVLYIAVAELWQMGYDINWRKMYD